MATVISIFRRPSDLGFRMKESNGRMGKLNSSVRSVAGALILIYIHSLGLKEAF